MTLWRARTIRHSATPMAVLRTAMRTPLWTFRWSTQALRGNASLRQVWFAMGAGVLVIALMLGKLADLLRHQDRIGFAALIDGMLFLVISAWLIAAWRCSTTLPSASMQRMGRAAAALGIVILAFTQ